MRVFESSVVGIFCIQQLVIIGTSSVLRQDSYKIGEKPTGRIEDFHEKDGVVLKIKNEDHLDSEENVALKEAVHHIPVGHFARHALCSHEHGRKKFYEALKHRLCSTKDTFIASFVENLCKHRGTLLDIWVSEVFDFDGDGYITHFERHFYQSDR